MGKVALVKLAGFFAVSLCLALVMFYPTITHAQMTNQARRTVTLKASDFLTGPFYLMATEIDGTNVHLTTLPDNLGHPILTMESSTIYGLRITHPITSDLTMVISSGSTAPATSTGVAIKTSLTDVLAGSTSIPITASAQLIAGLTVSSVTIKNEKLTIDTYLNSSTISIPDAQISIQAS
jgi:hypothetical protein